MIEITLEREDVNVGALDQELRSALGASFFGLRSSGRAVTAYVDERTADTDMNRVREIVAAHDPSRRTPDQEAEAAFQQQREAFLEAPVEPARFEAEGDLVRQLAERVAWLEGEIRRLTGG